MNNEAQGSTFLMPDEIQQLTGYQKPSYQKRWLAKRGYSFDVRSDGWPVVCRAYYEGCHNRNFTKRLSEPDLAALDDLE